MRSEHSKAVKFLMGPALALGSIFAVLTSCASNPAPQTESESKAPESAPVSVESVATTENQKVDQTDLPASYKDVQFPEFNYVAPYPKDYRVEVAPGITGYIVSDRSLPLVNFTVYFEESNVPASLKDNAASAMVGSMIRRGGGGGLSAHALDDSLEFISAGLSTSAGTFSSMFDIDCMSKDFPGMLSMAKQVLTAPAFDAEQLEIIKANYVTAYDRRYETPAKVLSALKSKVNYGANPRLWDSNAEEYKGVTAADVKRLAEGVYSSKKIIFALSGDVDKDSALVMMKDFFAGWKVQEPKTAKPAPVTLNFLRKPGIYVVDKDITQANISMNQPFVKRPHVDYYPAAVASFILGGGSFTSRLMNRVRSDEGLAYSVYSTVGNDYRDTAMATIALQTKVESVDFAIKLIFEEVEKLAKEGPSEEELAQAKKALIESLPSLFDSPSSTAILFAKGELVGKTFDHYLDYVKEINAVTADQVKAMVAKYFGKDQMTISIVAPVSKLESLKPFTVVPLDSLEFRN
ncbi:MAG: insulinase family protein [Fibrobacter sp.]|nr:insulinase family protein [Fibrobacter sp.]